MDQRIIEIAKDNGYSWIDRKLHEEIGELLMTKAKFDTSMDAEPKTEDELVLKQDNVNKWKSELAGEIADVKVMLDQITYVLGIEQEVEYDYSYKLDRQIKRIEERKLMENEM